VRAQKKARATALDAPPATAARRARPAEASLVSAAMLFADGDIVEAQVPDTNQVVHVPADSKLEAREPMCCVTRLVRGSVLPATA
jgi:hypothetical protein